MLKPCLYFPVYYLRCLIPHLLLLTINIRVLNNFKSQLVVLLLRMVSWWSLDKIQRGQGMFMYPYFGFLSNWWKDPLKTSVSMFNLETPKVEDYWKGISTTSLHTTLCRVGLLRCVNHAGYVSYTSCLEFIFKDVDISCINYLYVVWSSLCSQKKEKGTSGV